MRFILRKYVDAPNARAALRLDRTTRVHDVYLKDGEEPPKGAIKSAVGFWHPECPTFGFVNEPSTSERK